MVWADPRRKCSIASMRREWTWLSDTARIAPEEFKPYWADRAQRLAEGILKREAEIAAERQRIAWDERVRKATQRKERQKRLEKAFPVIREVRLEARKSRTTGRP